MNEIQRDEWHEDNVREARSVEWVKAPLSRILDPQRPADDHVHCIICWDALNPKYIDAAYESSIGWLCSRCYERYVVGGKES